jgi:hypothetical protein
MLSISEYLLYSSHNFDIIVTKLIYPTLVHESRPRKDPLGNSRQVT